MRILVIGGTRFMGPYVLGELAAEGHVLAVFHRGRSQVKLPVGAREILGDRKQIGEHLSNIHSQLSSLIIS